MTIQNDNTGGFTLAELLIALTLLGVIAVFTIPKVMTSVSTNSYNTQAKTVANLVQSAYNDYTIENAPGSSFVLKDLTPYLTYVRLQTTGTVDDIPTNTNLNCTNSAPCLVLQTGGTARMSSNDFGGTATTNAVFFNWDPDGIDSGLTSGDSKSVRFYIYFNGGLQSKGTVLPNTCNSSTCYNPAPTHDPSWFSWDQ